MRNFKKLIKVICLLFFTAAFFGCDSDTTTTDETARVIIRLVDAPGDFDEVNIDIQDILIKQNDDSDDDNGFTSISNGNTGVVNLLEFTGGNSMLLADIALPPGELNQIRLLLGDNNTVVIEGDSSELSTPSAQQSGLKLQVKETLEAGITYNFTIDFDVARSIVVQAGNSGRFNLRPVLRVITEATSGAIEGQVNPSDVQVMVEVTVGEETISTFTNENGAFLLAGVPEGTYAVTFTPDETSELSPVTIENVEVVNGETTTIGTIALE